jgi:hypothetical protein
MREHIANVSSFRFTGLGTYFSLGLSAIVLAGGQGCGGSTPLQPAHSSSFYPVRGTTDNGASAGAINWVYRINGGQAVALSPPSAGAIQFSDEDVTARDGSDITTSLQATVTASDGSNSSGHESLDQTDHLTPGSSPATVSERDVNIVVSIAGSGNQISDTEMLRYTFTPTPLPTYFDRDDLDALALGFSESQATQSAFTGTVTTTATGSPSQTQTASMTIPTSISWTLTDKLTTFGVLGHDYANVVEVQTTTVVTDPTTGMMQQGTANIWLAKGIGMIREDQSGSAFASTGAVTSELVSTSLVP